MMPRMFTALVAALTFAWPAHAQSPAVAPAATIHLVPIGAVGAELRDRLADYLEKRFTLPVKKHPQISLTKQMIDYTRRQVPAQEIFDVLEPKRAQLLRDGRGIVIGLTAYDMYIKGLDWEFAFAAREEPSLAAVSTFRMDEANQGRRGDEALLLARLEKMTAKLIGALALGLPDSSDPASGMYGRIRNLEDLDRISATF